MIEFSKESEMVPMGTSRKSGDLTWNDPQNHLKALAAVFSPQILMTLW